MSQTLEDKLKDLERKIAVKNAYLTVEFTFPKNSKLPADVKEQVVNELKNACLALAEDEGENPMTTSSGSFSAEEVEILKSIVAKVLGTQPASTSGTINASTPVQPKIPTQHVPTTKIFDSSKQGVKKARVITTENVLPQHRSKVSPDEEVYVTSIKDDVMARISLMKSGATLAIPVDDLEFNQ